MIVKEIKKENTRFVWYINERTNILYIIKITQNNEYKIIRKRRLGNKSKKKKISFLITSLIFLTYLTKPFILSLEDRKIIDIFINWDNMEEEEKNKKIIAEINELCEKNKYLNESQKEELKKRYPVFIKDYGEYLSKWDYLDILLSTRFVKVKEMEEEIKKNNVLTLAYYMPIEKIIYTPDNTSYFFHEKMHAMDHWLLKENILMCILLTDPLYDELYAGYTSNESYEDLKGGMSLIGELLGQDKLEQYIIERNPNKIWKELKQNLKGQEEKIKRLEKLLKEIYKKEYTKGQSVNQQKEEFWNIFKELYQEKTNKKLESDIIIDFFKDQLMCKTTLKNKNKINYENSFYIGSKKINIENRNKNYRDEILKDIQNNQEEYPFSTNIMWSIVQLANSKKYPTSYNEYEQFLQEYLNETESSYLFDSIVECENKDQYYEIINWLNNKIETKNEEIIRKRTKIIKIKTYFLLFSYIL